MKRILSLSLSLFLIIGTVFILPVSAATIIKSSDGAYKYRLHGKYAELIEYLDEDNPKLNEDGSYSIPSEIDGYTVRYLGDYLYHDYDVPSETVIIPDTVQCIGRMVFSFEDSFYVKDDDFGRDYEGTWLPAGRMKRIVIPDSVVSIDDKAFCDTVSLEEVVIPSSVYEMGESAFENSGVKKVTIKEGLNVISKYAFKNCKKLNNIDIPRSVVEINEGAFENCPKLKKLKLSDNVSTDRYFYGVNRKTNKAVKNHTIIFNCYDPKETVGIWNDYYYENNVSCKFNIIKSEKQYLSLANGSEFSLLFDNKTAKSYKSSNKKNVSVDKNGKVIVRESAGYPKTTKITAVDANGKTRYVMISSSALQLPYSQISVKTGKKERIQICGKAHSIKNVYYADKKGVAKIIGKRTNDYFYVKGLKKGTTTVKVKVNGIVLKLKVIVN